MATSTGDERWMMDWRQAAAVKLAPERPVPLVCLCPCQAPRFWFLIATCCCSCRVAVDLRLGSRLDSRHQV